MSSPLYVHSVLCFEDKPVGVRFCQETDDRKWKFFDAELKALEGVTESALASFPKETLLPFGDLLGTKSELSGSLKVKDLSRNNAFLKSALNSIHHKRMIGSVEKKTEASSKGKGNGMPVFSVLVEANTKYNPDTKKFDPMQFNADIEAKSALLARKIAKETYAQELGTEPDEIKILKCVLKDS